MAERISRRQFVTGSAFALGGLAAAAIVGCGEEEKNRKLRHKKPLHRPKQSIQPQRLVLSRSHLQPQPPNRLYTDTRRMV